MIGSPNAIQTQRAGTTVHACRLAPLLRSLCALSALCPLLAARRSLRSLHQRQYPKRVRAMETPPCGMTERPRPYRQCNSREFAGTHKREKATHKMTDTPLDRCGGSSRGSAVNDRANRRPAHMCCTCAPQESTVGMTGRLYDTIHTVYRGLLSGEGPTSQTQAQALCAS